MVIDLYPVAINDITFISISSVSDKLAEKLQVHAHTNTHTHIMAIS